MKKTIFLYYGVLCSKASVSSHMIQHNEKDMYSFILGKGLQYRKYGNIAIDYRIVVGKELCINIDIFNTDNLTLENANIVINKESLKNTNYILDSKTEQEIRTKLLEIGVYDEPKYYIFANWTV